MDIIEKFGQFNVFFFFMVTSFLGCIIFAGYSIETQGKTDDEIKQAFVEKKFFA